ncbi:MAG: arginine--tRNA ligase, partial [Candidatus Eremiobacteraeota bacterium]|nr:arginine--tRNA ligase [Candidatus Eremiobacteraeota bacterium]
MNRTITSGEGLDDLARLAGALSRAAAELVPGDDPPAVVFESPRNPDFGDFASNVALQLAKRARRAPQQLALQLVDKIFADDPSLRDIALASAVGGFLNVRLAPAHWQRVVARVLTRGDDYGRGAATGERVSLEFGSANPTGPLVVVQGRTLSLGDSIAKAMRFAGIDVTTEWIINDAGSQVETLGRSLHARYRQMVDPAFSFPEDGYPGDYLKPIAAKLRARDGDRWDGASDAQWLPACSEFGLSTLVAEQRATSERFGVLYDRWQSEKELHQSGAVTRGIEALRERGHTFERDGATWMRTTDFADDKDRVLVRSDGRPTY